MTIQEIKEKCEDWVVEGLAYHEIKGRLRNYDLSDEDKSSLLSMVDQEIAHRELLGQSRQNGAIRAILGILFMFLAVVMILYTPSIGRTLPFIVLGIGFYLFRRGYHEYKNPVLKKPIEEKKRKSRFDRF